MWGFCRRVWKGERWPEKWKQEIIVPIVKKREGAVAENYRGVMQMATTYKIYAAMLTEKLWEEMKRKGMLHPNQTGFRRGVGTIDNIYVLNYIMNRRLEKREGKLVVLSVDLRAFDTVDRRMLVKAVQDRGIRKELTLRVEEMMMETKSRVTVEGELGEDFWTSRGVRQG